MRLIDADELMKHKGNCYDEEGHLLYAVGTGTIMRMPTIDAVPVVRCRNCKHWNFVMKESDFGLCDAWVTLYIATGGGEYCKRGEAKED